MNRLKNLFAFCVFSFFAADVSAQTSFNKVYQLLQANCADAGCHGAVNPKVFSVDGSESDVYHALVGVSVTNETAAAKGYKLVDSGHPYNSFLLNKAGADFDSYLALSSGEGEVMCGSGKVLEDYDIELIRQWILMGARQNVDDVNYTLLKDYYTNGGIQIIPVPQAPEPSKGRQIRMGPIFIAPGGEVEWDKKEHLRNTDMIKAYKTDGYMSWESHHMLLFKYDDDGSGVREGMRLVPSESTPFNGNVTLTGAWQNDAEFELPNRTAFYWQPNTILDFDYHIKNYSQTQILPSDFYLNIYFDTENERDIEMHASLVNNLILLLFQGDNTRVATDDFSEDRYIYMISSHTHQWGTDYDIFLNNNDGSRGEQIYEGFYSEDYAFNQGFYDWQHPAIRYFTPLKKASNGLAYEVKYNVGVPFVTFGLTADDEMMLFTYLYTKEEVPPTAIEETQNTGDVMRIAPNPMNQQSEIKYSISSRAEVKIEVHDLLGRLVTTLVDASLNKGNYREQLSLPYPENEGIFFVTLSVNGERKQAQKLVVSR
ncbi:MAG: T9SS type A sorting domain-containing protein [Chitinophagales bacterium]|nr:T9SS type A sorting domain-containing protein [Chitinophagales bacterium]